MENNSWPGTGEARGDWRGSPGGARPAAYPESCRATCTTRALIGRMAGLPAMDAVTITGQLCTPKDVLARRVAVKRLRAGDVVASGMAGAYAWNISHHDFLMHPPRPFIT